MHFYRIDRRIFQIGDIITPDAAFIKNADRKRQSLEELFENNRPKNKPNRNEVVKLFDSFEAAKKYWILDSDSNFYTVETKNGIEHFGDYSLVQQMSVIDDQDLLNDLAKRYWNEAPGDDAIIEYFSIDPKVIKIVCNNPAVRENTKRQYYGFPTIQGCEILKNDN